MAVVYLYRSASGQRRMHTSALVAWPNFKIGLALLLLQRLYLLLKLLLALRIRTLEAFYSTRLWCIWTR